MEAFELFRQELIGEAHCISVIGGGGKSSLLYALREPLSKRGRVILATSTHFFADSRVPVYLRADAEDLKRYPVLCVASLAEHGKLGPPLQSFDELKAMSDYLLIEADGSRQRPLKAHAAYEPVLPACTEGVLGVVGIDAVGSSIASAAHRVERCCEILHAPAAHILCAEDLLTVIRQWPAINGLVINKADTAERLTAARRLAALSPCPAAVCALQREKRIIEIWRNGTCLYS